MKVYVVTICRDSHKFNHDKPWEEGTKEIKRVNSGILRIFANKEDAKRYISEFYDGSTTNNASLEQKEKKDGSMFSAKLVDYYSEDKDDSATWDGIKLKGCDTTVTIKVQPMEVTEGSDFPFLDDDMYDVFVEEKEERGFEI